MGARFEPRSVAKLRAKLDALTPAAREGVAEALDKVGGRIERSAKRRAPRLTGALRKSITHEVDNKALTLAVGTDLFYSRFVEFGTVDTPAQPFLFPAAKASRRRNAKEIAQSIEPKLKRVARRG
jgi:HK97 gp10 family phage protein